MKKLMIAAAIVCAAAFAQAASCSWSTGMQLKAPTSSTDGTFGSNYLSTDSQLATYVWIVDSTVYGKTEIADIWGTYGSTLNTASGSNTIGKEQEAGATDMKKSLKATTDGISYTADQDNPVYALIITTLDVNDDGKVDWYIANKAEGNINGYGVGTDLNNLAKNIGGTGGTAITGWTAVPEPTSGLLLLLGVAGLALRRRRA